MGPGVIQAISELTKCLFNIVRVDVVEGVLPHQFVLPVTEYALDRGALVANGAVGLENRDNVRGVLDQGAKSLLAPMQCFLGPLALGDVLDLGDEVESVALVVAY